MSCPSCGAVSDPGARFCSSCGGPLARASDERRVVTVLFADLVGYTTLAEPLDPEKVKNLIDHVFQRLVADITECGGQVDKIVGDAIVALFGAPTAHEDDAERAVRAALRMQQTLGSMAGETGASEADAIRMRIGVNTGEVLVGALRAGGSITAMGDVVNTASRLQTSAAPGEVVVGAATHRATRGVIRYEPRGLLTAKGREERVEAWVAVEALLPPGYRPNRRTVPMVGRADELSLLRNVVDSSVGNRRALLALLVGDAGVGKTRLAEEVACWASEEHGTLAIEGRCVPYGEANVWWPVAEALRHACFVEVGADADDARRRTRDRVGQALDLPAEAPEVDRVTTGLLHLMGYESALKTIDASNAREEAIRSVVTFVEGSTRHQPVMIQLSDLHWADEVVLELVDTLLERLARQPFVLVATARQAIRERWSPRPGRHNFLAVNLDPLEDEAAGELLDSLVSSAPSPELREALVVRSGGNPFFLEELVSLVGDRVPAADGSARAEDDELHELPDTLRGLVAARLDGLTIEERAVLTDGAVLGRRGSVDHLRRVSDGMGRVIDVDAAVAELVAKELFELTDGEWSFRSDLVREVAYNTITKLDRARRHIGIAAYIEEHHGDELTDTVVDKMAHHYGVGAGLLTELGSAVDGPDRVRARAVRWISEAADRARRTDLLPMALRLSTQALALLDDEPSEQRIAILLGRSHVRAESWDIDGARADAQAAIAEADLIGHPGCQARGLLALGDVAQKAGDSEGAVALLRDAGERFAALGDDQGRGEALRLEGMAELFRGAVGPAEVAVRAALEAFRSTGSRSGEAWALQNLAWIAFTTGRADEAEGRLQRAIATFTEIGDGVGTAWSVGLLAFVKFQQGHHQEARALGRGVLEEARARGDRWATGMMSVLMAMLDLWSGHTEQAVVQAQEAATLFAEIGDPYGRTQATAPLARALAMVGRVEEGLATFDAALELATAMPGVEAMLLAQVAVAGAHVQLGDPERALHGDMFGRGGSLASGIPADSETVVIYALACLQQGRSADAEAALAGLPNLDETGPRPFTRTALALAASAAGRIDEAVEHAERAAEHSAATYLDLATIDAAVGLAMAGAGREAEARRWLDQACARVDATEDRLDQAVARLARAVGLDAMGTPDAIEAMADACDRLDAMGVTASGWRTAFALAAGAGAGTSLTTS